jgi:putative endonuclease
MNYSYVLLSEKDRKFYIGSTGDLRERMREHNQGRVRSTAYRRPLRLIYYEACLNVDDARRRERYLKTGRGGRYLKQRLASWLSETQSNKLERHY